VDQKCPSSATFLLLECGRLLTHFASSTGATVDGDGLSSSAAWRREMGSGEMETRRVFVQVEGGGDGVGKLVDIVGKRAEIEYFESPAGPTLKRVQVPLGSLRELELAPQTRAFWFDPERQAWRAGRVNGGPLSAQALKATEDHYAVRFPNGHDALVPISELYVRWSHPIEDPTDYLAARITDTPLFFDGRSQIVRYLATQRAAFGGLSGLASSAVELLEHQVATVRRILADPVGRYLLADEVGLGKTIEAGILIRQHIIDQPREARVLVVVPAHLVQQWKSELADKFFLAPDSGIRVVSEEVLRHQAEVFEPISLLVVDEAQRIAIRAFDADPERRQLYEGLRALASTTPRLLLLSGTPVLHQEEGFLAMLHLLDPDGYPLRDRDQFRHRVRERQTVAEASLDLADDASAYFAGEAVDKLEQRFSEDLRLVDLCRTVRKHLEQETSNLERIWALRALRTHLSETYRLHRRLLRTRRDDPRVQDHLPSRAGAIRLQHEDGARQEAFDFLDAWRLALPGTTDSELTEDHARLFALWVAAALSHPRVLARHIDARLALLNPSAPLAARSIEVCQVLGIPKAFDGEETLLRERRQLVMQAVGVDARAERFVAWLRSNGAIRKTIVFIDDSEVADLLTNALQEALGSQAVIRFNGDVDAARSFERQQSLSVLVCDASAEEGLNLQRYGAAVVHFDLPLEPARIEQRIGRIDRLEARGRMHNVVLTADCPYENEWLACLSDTMRVFDRSIAPLQYVLAEATATIRSELLIEGRMAFEQAKARMGDPLSGLDAELRRIRAQEALDSVEGDADADAAFFAGLLNADEAAETDGETSLNSWVVERLQFVCRRIEPGVIQYIHDLGRPTLIPLLETVTRFEACIDRGASARDARKLLPLQPITFERSKAESKRLGLLRVGHPFMNALESLVRSDDRGTAFVMWRYLPKFTAIPRIFFRFDFVIESDLNGLQPDVAERISIESLRRRAHEAFPVEHQTVWLDGDLQPVLNQQLVAILASPFHQQPRINGSRDVNVRLERWDRVEALASIGDWDGLCRRARAVAEGQIQKDPLFKARCARQAARIRDLATVVDESLQSRISRLSGPARVSEEGMAALELSLSEVVARGIESPVFRVDSAGAVFLASQVLEEP
jgi:ATP-dependent helicase HepA